MQERLTAAETTREGQDDIDASKAPLMEHLIELRSRLMWAVGAFIVMFFACFAVAGHIYNVLVWPYMWASGNDSVRLIATHFLEQIMTQMKLAMFGAGFLSFPVVATQIYKFVAPGLYKNERRAFLPYLAATPVLFVIGAAVVYFIAMPVLIKFSIGLTQTTGHGTPTIELMPKVSEYLSLIMTLIFGFGIVFQLPVVLTLLARAGFRDGGRAQQWPALCDCRDLRGGGRFDPARRAQHGHHGAADRAFVRSLDFGRAVCREETETACGLDGLPPGPWCGWWTMTNSNC